jgi:hypothetical protein
MEMLEIVGKCSRCARPISVFLSLSSKAVFITAYIYGLGQNGKGKKRGGFAPFRTSTLGNYTWKTAV